MIKTVTEEGTIVHNFYNAEGYRTGKEVNGEKTYYLYEADKIILEVDEAGNQKARNVYGTNLILRTVDGETYYYLYNGHADVTALITREGTIAATYYYDAFGNILESTGEVNNNIRYSGYQYEEETGLYYVNARMYDPKTARFLQEDTYTGDPNDPLSLNLYMYCNNNPLIYNDPTGHAPNLLKNAGKWLVHKVMKPVLNFTSEVIVSVSGYKDLLVEHTDLLENIEEFGKIKSSERANSFDSGITSYSFLSEVKGPYVLVGEWGYGDTKNDTNGLGVSLGEASWEMAHTQGDYKYGGAGLGAVKVEGSASMNIKEGIDLGAMGSLVNGDAYAKIPIPFTGYSLKMGVGGYLFGIGAEVKLAYGSKKEIKFGASAIVGASVTLGLENQKKKFKPVEHHITNVTDLARISKLFNNTK